MSAAATQAVQTDSAPVPETTPSFTPPSVSDVVRGGVAAPPFRAGDMADPAAAVVSSSGAGRDVLAQLSSTFTTSNLRSARETLRLAQDLETLVGGDQPPRLPPTPPTMKLPAGRARPAQPPKAAPRTASHRALALSGSRGRQQQQLQQLLLKLLGERTG